MARILRPDSPARARASILAAIRGALADLGTAADQDDLRDRLAYAGLALRELERSIERTVEAWERRGYWVKADQFRREWSWVGQAAHAIITPLREEDLESARHVAKALLPRLPIAASEGRRRASDTQWAGAFERLQHDRRGTHGS